MTTGMLISILIFLPIILFTCVALYAMEVPYEERQARHYDRLAARQYEKMGEEVELELQTEKRLKLAQQLEEVAAEWRDGEGEE